MKNICLLLGVLILLSTSCQRDIDEITDITTVKDPPITISDYNPDIKMITASLVATIVDETHDPVVGAAIFIQNESYTTDKHGIVIMRNIEMDEFGTYVVVQKDGYFKGGRRFFPKEGSKNYITVELLPQVFSESFEGGAGGTIEGPEGLSIFFPAGAIQNAAGNLYEGEVHVAAQFLNPTKNNIGDIMPGNLQGVNNRLEEVALASYGMMAVELVGAGGEPLNITEGKTAALTFPIPEALRNNAPAEIPLWYFEDEEYGIWVEDGIANRIGNEYIGEVSHFSFWNCDAPFPLINLTGTLVTRTGIKISNKKINIHIDGSNIVGSGTTDDLGFFSGKVPMNQALTLVIQEYNDCSYSPISLGSFTTDTDLLAVLVLDAGDAFRVSGTVVDCNNIPLTESLLVFTLGTYEYIHYLDGTSSFDLPILNCSSETQVTVLARNPNSFEEGDIQIYTIAPQINTGPVMACGNPTSTYLIYRMNDEVKNYANGSAKIDGAPGGNTPGTYISFIAPGTSGSTAFSMLIPNGLPVGTYTVDSGAIKSLGIFVDPAEFSIWRWNACSTVDCPEFENYSLNITTNDGLGGNIIGSVEGSGEFYFENGNNNLLTEEFEIKFKYILE